MELRNVGLIGTGHAVPDKIMSNEDLSRIVDTSDEWITTRTGIKRRHHAVEGELNSDFAAEACRQALAMAGRRADEVDFIIIGTVTGDLIFPSTACIVQEKIGATGAAAWDMSAACTGFLFGIAQAKALLASGAGSLALVVGSEVLSRLTDWKDRGTCVLFGDGAGAVLLEASENHSDGPSILSTVTHTDGRLVHMLNAPAGGTAIPLTADNLDDGDDKIRMKGNEVFKHAVRNMGGAAMEALEIAKVAPEDVKLFIPHQANIRIIEALASRLTIPGDRVYVNIQEYGNTSAASIPIALDEARRKELIGPGDHVLMAAFGGGLTWGAVLVRL